MIKKITVPVLFVAGSAFFVNAQEAAPFSKSLGLYVFPNEGQDAATQAAHETECYSWAKQQSGVDPINPPDVRAAEVDTSPDGSMVGGAARGAAAGVAIGAIAGDAGKGAAIGAVAGGIGGRRAKKRNEAYQQQANEYAAAAYSQELMDNFNKAFSACLEAKGYTVK